MQPETPDTAPLNVQPFTEAPQPSSEQPARNASSPKTPEIEGAPASSDTTDSAPPTQTKVANRDKDGLDASGKSQDGRTLAERLSSPPDIVLAPFDDQSAKIHQQEWSNFHDVPLEFTNSVGMKFRLIPPGEFQMGSPAGEPGRSIDEDLHEVVISQPFYLGETEVTMDQYARIMEKREIEPDANIDPLRHPIEDVSWERATSFCQKLSATEQRIYRLPTEAEWEYACRAGTSTAFHFGNRLTTRSASYGLADPSTKAVGSYPANAFGLFDMHGNAAEWCFDWFHSDFYRRSPVKDPVGRPQQGGFRVARGGSFRDPESLCRSSARLGRDSGGAGFRVLAKAERVGPSRRFEPSGFRNAWGITSVDCDGNAHQVGTNKLFDLTDSWTVSLEFNAKQLDSDFQCLFTWGDMRPGRDAVCLYLDRASLRCWTCDCNDNSAEYLHCALPMGSDNRWIKVRLDHDRRRSMLRFYVDGNLASVDEALIVPQLDRPSPAWIGNIGANAGELRRFVGQVRNFSMANIERFQEVRQEKSSKAEPSLR